MALKLLLSRINTLSHRYQTLKMQLFLASHWQVTFERKTHNCYSATAQLICGKVSWSLPKRLLFPVAFLPVISACQHDQLSTAMFWELLCLWQTALQIMGAWMGWDHLWPSNFILVLPVWSARILFLLLLLCFFPFNEQHTLVQQRLAATNNKVTGWNFSICRKPTS